MRFTYEKVAARFMSAGYTLLSVEYKNCDQKLDVFCPAGHKTQITFHSFQSGHGCRVCSENKPSLDLIRDKLAAVNRVLLSDRYVNAHTPLEYVCDRGHRGYVTWGNLSRGLGYCRR